MVDNDAIKPNSERSCIFDCMTSGCSDGLRGTKGGTKGARRGPALAVFR